MKMLRFGYGTAPAIGAFWMVVLSVTVAIAMSFITGDAIRPQEHDLLAWRSFYIRDVVHRAELRDGHLPVRRCVETAVFALQEDM